MKRMLNIVALSALLCGVPVQAAINAFACEPEWGALTHEIGGDKVSVYQATTGLQDPHRIEARPSLIARMRSADLLVCSGADLEVGWLPLLLQTSGNGKVQSGQPGNFMASDFVTRLEVPTAVDRAQGDIHPYGNPHIHLDPHNVLRVAQALGCRAAIGADQAAGAELDAAVPARDYHADVVVSLAVDRGEDRAPCGARRFAVVAGPVFGTDAVGPAVVGRIAIGAGGEEGEGDVDAGRGRGLRMESTVADFDRVRGRRGERVRHRVSARRFSGSV